MKQHLPDLQTAFLCTFFILAASMGTMLFSSPKANPLAATRSAPEGLEIFTLTR